NWRSKTKRANSFRDAIRHVWKRRSFTFKKKTKRGDPDKMPSYGTHHWVVAMMHPPRDGKMMTSKHRKPPNQRCCFLFRIEGYESCRRLRLRARPSASHR